MVFFPPRHGKSTMCSELFPAWYLGNNSDHRVILTSYEAGFARTWGRRARDILVEHGPTLYDARISQSLSAASDWEIQRRAGGMLTAGIGGGILGRGADLFAIDDPVKNAQEARSPVSRESVWQWYTTTALTRLQPNAIQLLMMSRWNEDDLAGRLLKEMDKGGDQWEVLRFPALSKDEDGNDVALWPSHYDVERLQEIRRTLGPYWWGAVYQQDPKTLEGGVFNLSWWQYRELPENLTRTIQIWDTAFKVGTRNDFNVCATWSESSLGYHVRNVYRERLQYPDLKEAVKQQYAMFKPDMVGIEDKASGQSLIQDLRRETKIPIIAIPAEDDKFTRATRVSGHVQAGRCYLPLDAPWVTDFVDEHANFPNGTYDDQVDTTSMAINEFVTHTGRIGLYL